MRIRNEFLQKPVCDRFEANAERLRAIIPENGRSTDPRMLKRDSCPSEQEEPRLPDSVGRKNTDTAFPPAALAVSGDLPRDQDGPISQPQCQAITATAQQALVIVSRSNADAYVLSPQP